MPINDKMGEASLNRQESNNVFLIQSIVSNLRARIANTIARMAEINQQDFHGVDDELKQEATALHGILTAAKNALDGHAEFLDWTP